MASVPLMLLAVISRRVKTNAIARLATIRIKSRPAATPHRDKLSLDQEKLPAPNLQETASNPPIAVDALEIVVIVQQSQANAPVIEALPGFKPGPAFLAKLNITD